MATLRKAGPIQKLGSRNASSPGIPTSTVPTKSPGRPPPNPGQQTKYPRGPALLHLGQKPIPAPGGPSDPPVYFIETATVSQVEWILYWASAKYFNDPLDPREPPYTGSRSGEWEYQIPELAGAPRSIGNSVTDFVYHLGSGDILLRLDTFHWHLEGDPAQQARDHYLKLHAGHLNVEVRSIYDFQLLGDPSGAAAVRALADVLAGREAINPVRSGLAYAPRDLVFA